MRGVVGGAGEQGEAAQEGLLGRRMKVKFHSKRNAAPWMVLIRSLMRSDLYF